MLNEKGLIFYKKLLMLTLAICTYNRASLLSACFETIKNQDYQGVFELLIIDNNSTDNTRLICQKLKENTSSFEINYFLETVQGLANARNRAIQEAKGEYIYYLDDDVLLPSNFIRTFYQEVYASRNKIYAFGGKIIPHFNVPKPLWYNKYTAANLYAAHDEGDVKKVYRKGIFPYGANMGFYRPILLKHQVKFNPNLGRIGSIGLNGEETAFCSHLSKLGYAMYYIPKLSLKHQITANRLEEKYIKNLSEGYGKSLWIYNKNKGFFSQLSALIDILYKYFGTLGLVLYYFLFKRNSHIAMHLLSTRGYITKDFFRAILSEKG